MDRRDWDERYRQKEPLFTAEPSRFLVGGVKGLEPGTALDLASGQGRNAVWLAEQGWKVTGVDWSDVAAERARLLAAERGVDVEWVVADLMEWESPGPTFDLVTVVYLQLPIAEREAIWRKAAATVGPGGRLVIVGHDSRNLEEGWGGPSHPSVLYRASEVSTVVGEALEIMRAETVVRPVDTEDGTRYAIDNLVVAERA
jgi:2-polyprenyl-3-methyl-5-hydroxy-6-metoxy-1,4-benzoquinol methylase